jgi:hypothetical protein
MSSKAVGFMLRTSTMEVIFLIMQLMERYMEQKKDVYMVFIAKKTAKWAVSKVRGRMYDELYQRLGTKEGEKDIYRMAKSRERKTRDIIQVKCIKDETERLLTKDEDIKNRWREYFDKLFNDKDMHDNVVTSVRTSDGDTNDFPINIGLH